MAASIAFKDGMRKASPVLLEPMMSVEVETPADFMGNVVGDLSSRRGMIQGMDDLPGLKVIRAEVPLVGNVWLCYLVKIGDSGTCDLYHGVQALFRSADGMSLKRLSTRNKSSGRG